MAYKVSYDANAVQQSASTIPVAAKCDVIVCGGGTAGVGAAIAAARNGADTVVIERAGFPGGVVSGTMMGVAWSTFEGLSGLGLQIFKELVDSKQAIPGPIIPFDHEGFKDLAMRKLQESRVKTLFYTMAVDTIREDGLVLGVVIENKSGRQAILGKTVIDCTGDGDMCALAGAEFIKGRTQDGKMRPVTKLFRLGSVDVNKVLEWAIANRDQFLKDENINVIRPDLGLVRLHGFYSLADQARANGDLPDEVHYVRFEYLNFQNNTVLVNSVRVYGIDGTNGWDLARAEMETQQQVRQVERFCRKYVPGCENAFLLDTSSMLGVRETRHIVGDYMMEDKDVYDDPAVADAILRNSTMMPKYTEVHSADGNEGARSDAGNRELPWELVQYSIPYRALLVKGFDNLLVAGRCMSSYHEADRLTRHITACLGTGEAVGTAAALAFKGNCTPRRLDIGLLQATLEAQGVDVGRPSKN